MRFSGSTDTGAAAASTGTLLRVTVAPGFAVPQHRPSAFAVLPGCLAVGTESGHVLVYDTHDGSFVSCVPLSPSQSPITAMCLTTTAAAAPGTAAATGNDSNSSSLLGAGGGVFVVVAASATTGITAIECKGRSPFDLGGVPTTSTSSSIVTSLALPGDFALTGSTTVVYFGTQGGQVAKRTRGMMYGFNDTVLFSAPPPTSSATGTSSAVCCLTVMLPYVLFACRDSVYVYSEAKRMVLARFIRPTATGPQSYGFDVVFNAQQFIVKHGASVYFCQRDTDSIPFKVQAHYQAPREIAAIGMVAESVLMVVTSVGKEQRRQAEQDQGDVQEEEQLRLEAQQEQRAYVALLSLPDMQQIGGTVLPFAADSNTRRLIGMRTILCPKPLADTLPQNQYDRMADTAAPTGSAGLHQPPQQQQELERVTFIVYTDQLVIVRPLHVAEQIVALMLKQQYAQAMTLCQRFKRTKVVTEVANEYACQLWREKKHNDAMHMWAEYVLPLAGAEFWTAFALKLQKAGRLSLLEPYLPFNDRSLLSAEMYGHVLQVHLDAKDYETFYSRISRWPVVYAIDDVIESVKAKVLEVIHEQQNRPEDQRESIDPVRFLLRSLFKLLDFQNDYIAAAQVVVEVSPDEALEYAAAHNLWPKILVGLDLNSSRLPSASMIQLCVSTPVLASDAAPDVVRRLLWLPNVSSDDECLPPYLRLFTLLLAAATAIEHPVHVRHISQAAVAVAASAALSVSKLLDVVRSIGAPQYARFLFEHVSANMDTTTALFPELVSILEQRRQGQQWQQEDAVLAAIQARLK